jgi:hypothetical protein
LGFRALVLEFRVYDLGLIIQGLDLRFRVRGSGFRVQGLRFKV